MEAEGGDGAREGAGVGAGHAEVEEQLHFLVLPRQEGLVGKTRQRDMRC